MAKQSNKSHWQRAWAFLRLIRADNLLLLLFTQYLARVFLIGPSLNWAHIISDGHLLLLSLSAMCIVAAGFVINDYYDVKIDAINQPGKVLIGRSLRRRTAMLWHSLFNAAGIGIGFWLSWRIGLLNLLAAFLVWLYSNQLKRMPLVGNLALGALSSIAILAVSVYYHEMSSMMLIFAIFAYTITLIRSIVKDMADLRGDMHFGCKTLPIIWGIRRTKAFIYLVMTLCVVSTALIIPAQHAERLNYYFLVMLYPIVLFTYRLYWADTRQAYESLNRLCKNIMVGGIVAITLV